MNELLHFFTKGLIIMLLIVLGLSLLGRIKKTLAFLAALWIVLALLAFLVLPLVVIIWVILLTLKN